MQAPTRLLLCALLGLSLNAGLVQAENLRLIRGQPALKTPDPLAESLGLLPAGLVVDAQKRQGDWVRVRSDQIEGWVRVQALARVEGDSSAWSTILGLFKSRTGVVDAPAGMRGPQASRTAAHALILTIADYGAAAPALPGSRRDADSGVLMARLLGVPEEQTLTLADQQLSLAGLRAALDELEARRLPNDEVLLYFSGHGTRVQLADGTCADAWLAADGQALGGQELAQRLRRIAEKTSRLLVFIDAGKAAADPQPAGLQAKYRPGQCEAAGEPPAGQESGNLLWVEPAAGQPAFDDASRGGLATRAWLDCLAASGRDLDRSGGLSASEVAACAQPLYARMAAPAQPQLQVRGQVARVLKLSEGSRPELPAVLGDIHANRDPRRQVSLAVERQPFRNDQERLYVRVSSSQPGYLYLLRADAGGRSLELLFPNPGDEANYVPAGVALTLPRPWWLIQPTGQDWLLAMVSDSPRDFSRLGAAGERRFLVLSADDGRSELLQALAAVSSHNGQPLCQPAGRRMQVGECSDAYGAALVHIGVGP
jgi:hypothetical protein